MDIQHTSVVWRLLFDHISALNNQNWISFLVFAAGICIYCVEGDFSHGSSRAFSANRGAWRGIRTCLETHCPSHNQGIEPPRFYPTH